MIVTSDLQLYCDVNSTPGCVAVVINSRHVFSTLHAFLC